MSDFNAPMHTALHIKKLEEARLKMLEKVATYGVVHQVKSYWDQAKQVIKNWLRHREDWDSNWKTMSQESHWRACPRPTLWGPWDPTHRLTVPGPELIRPLSPVVVAKIALVDFVETRRSSFPLE